jgi:hypothetical protein
MNLGSLIKYGVLAVNLSRNEKVRELLKTAWLMRSRRKQERERITARRSRIPPRRW